MAKGSQPYSGQGGIYIDNWEHFWGLTRFYVRLATKIPTPNCLEYFQKILHKNLHELPPAGVAMLIPAPPCLPQVSLILWKNTFWQIEEKNAFWQIENMHLKKKEIHICRKKKHAPACLPQVLLFLYKNTFWQIDNIHLKMKKIHIYRREKIHNWPEFNRTRFLFS